MSRIDVFIDAGQGDNQNTIGGFRTGAYVVKAVSENREKIFWGIGRVRNPQAFFAEAVVAALRDVFEEALDGSDRKFDIRIICAKTGWWEQLDHLRGREKKSQAAALEIDQRDSWMRLGAYEAMLGLQKPESPCGPKDYAELEALADLKRAYAKKASLTVPQPCQGIFDQGIVDEGSLVSLPIKALTRSLPILSDFDRLCTIPGCGRQTAFSTETGLARFHCRYHTQYKARHGSHWHGTYSATELKPYVLAASLWLQNNSTSVAVSAARWEIEYLLSRTSRVEPAMNLRGLSAQRRADIAFARLRAAEIPSERIMAIYLSVSALIEDDWQSHNVREFRIVQAAKAMHRLASGTHRKWDVWIPRLDGTVPYEMHAYPRSSGIVLRKMGEAVEKACGQLPKTAVPEIIELKTRRFGRHPSHPAPSPQETRPK